MLTASSVVAAQSSDMSGAWVAAITGYDATELPSEDGPDQMVGLNIGYNWIRGNKLFGIEAEFGTSNAARHWDDYSVSGDHLYVDFGRDIYVGLRAGLKLTRRLAGYGKIGYANTLLKLDYDGPPEYRERYARPGALYGFSTGAGIEWSISDRWLLKSEYRYSNFHDGLYRQQGVIGVGFRIDTNLR